MLREINFKLWTKTQKNKIRNTQTRKIIFGGNFPGKGGVRQFWWGQIFWG